MRQLGKAALWTVVLLGLFAPVASAYDKLSYVGAWDFTAGNGSDCWGWTAPDGTEYALMGYRNGIGIVRTTPSVMLVDTIPGPMGGGGFIWRDIKTYGHYAYATSEASGEYSGLMVMDLSYLPDSVKYLGSFSTNGGTGYTSHNINIDTAAGYAYVEGSTAEKVRILSLANPEQPVYVNSFGTSSGSIHDIYARNDTVYVAEGSPGTWSIWDLSNKLNPRMLVRISVPNAGYVHNIWPSDDGNYCVTTEETFNKTIKVWDISDLGNVQLLSQYLAPNRLAHNAHWFGNFHVNSHYESGIQLVDATDPANPVEVDRVDIWPADDGAAYNGTWGAYPYTQNGYVYASNTDGRLWIFELTDECPLAGVPTQVFPTDGSGSFNQPDVLTWSDEGADSYRVQVDDDPAFGSPEYDSSVTVNELEISGLALTTTYYWRVRAANTCGESAWSEAETFTTGCIIALTGDVDVSGTRTATDVIELVNYIFKSGDTPMPVEAAGDVNCSGTVTAEDIVFMVNYVFKSGAEPCDACAVI
jgi:choice-of-anchor B domain-containing protein